MKLPIVRNTPPPCYDCPKGIVVKKGGARQPDFLRTKMLHRRNYRAYEFWQEIKATMGAQPVPKHLEGCAVFAENMAMIARIVKNAEYHLQAKAYEQRDR